MFNIFSDDDQSVISTSLDEIVDRELARSAICEEIDEKVDEEDLRAAEIAKIKAQRKPLLIKILREVKQRKADEDFRKIFFGL
ncbi:MAG: hypothetical protein J5934_07740 [Succinivibrio sp.]|nr:hypothetical protein [Succinivibrio sp.]